MNYLCQFSNLDRSIFGSHTNGCGTGIIARQVGKGVHRASQPEFLGFMPNCPWLHTIPTVGETAKSFKFHSFYFFVSFIKI